MTERKPLTIAEQKWIARVNKALKACPSKRMGFATMGDPQVTIYDKRFEAEIEAEMDKGNGDFLPAVTELDLELGVLDFPGNVHSTAA